MFEIELRSKVILFIVYFKGIVSGKLTQVEKLKIVSPVPLERDALIH